MVNGHSLVRRSEEVGDVVEEEVEVLEVEEDVEGGGQASSTGS